MNELALFAGAGGGILGGKLLGWRTVCAVEYDAYRAAVLASRQNDGLLKPFPIWSDVRTFDGIPWRGLVDVVSGGSPCQGFSTAGKGAGLDDPRSGLILEMLRIIGEVRPRFALLENSPIIRGKGLALVIGELAKIGYASRWDTFSVAGVGGPHLRKRLFLVAYLDEDKRQRELLHSGQGPEGSGKANAAGVAENGDTPHTHKDHGNAGRLSIGAKTENTGANVTVADSNQIRRNKANPRSRPKEARENIANARPWPDFDPDFLRVVHGVPHRVDRIEALGDSQVPRVVKEAWRWLTK